MFTGIIEETGTIRHISRESNSARLSVAAARVLEGTSEGDSIAVNGVCLTVTSLLSDRFSADVMHETLDRSALAGLTGVTKIIIAQRVTSVMHTDLIVILEDGRVHATGTHAQLLASDPIYQEIYASQMKGGEDHGGPATQREKA